MSSEIVVEVANWPASDAYKTDPSVIIPALEQLAATKGALKIWHGLQHEDQTTVYLIIAWENFNCHKVLIDDKEAYAKLGAALAPVRSGDINLYHLAFKPVDIPVDHLNAPITELVTQTIREGKTNEDLEAIVYRPEINSGGKAFAIGKKVERGDQYVLCKGWESVEAHKAEATNERVVQFITAVHQVVTPQVAHVKLTAYKA